MSLAHYAKFVKFNLNVKSQKWKIMNQPTNEGWISIFVKLIKKMGVTIKLNHELQKINHNKKKNCKLLS